MAVSNQNLNNQILTSDRQDWCNDRGEIFDFQALLEHTQVAILIYQDERVCYANPITKALTGYNQDELLIHTKLQAQLQLKSLSQKLKSEKYKITPDQEIKFLTKSGQECWLDCSLGVIDFAHRPAIFITAVDITKHKQAEQKIQQVLKREKELVSLVSHELRTPLNIIAFSTNLLKTYSDRWKSAKVKNYLARVQRGVDTLNLLIDEWLILDKVNQNKLKLKPQEFHLEQFCHNLISDLQLSSEHYQQINFSYRGDDSWVTLDRRILQLILTNLLENAWKYSPQNKAIDLIIKRNHQEIIFHIKDRGRGIKPSDLQQLFEPFYRGDNVDDIPGHGLGLAIVNQLVKLSGGRINVTSQLGTGTEFTLSFPQLASTFLN